MPRRSIEALVEPSLLKWARESIGFSVSEIAKRLKTEQSIVENWEKGRARVTVSLLEKLANYYKRPLAAFFLPKPPIEPVLPKDYRTLPDSEKAPLSKDTLLAIRRARRIQSLTTEFRTELGCEPIRLPIQLKLSDDPENVSIQIRKATNISVERQYEWKNELEAFRQWRKAIEGFGIIVTQASIQRQARALSITEGDIPVTLLNTKDTVRARIFSLFHELTHVLLNRSGICDMRNPDYLPIRDRELESFCNRTAGTVLVPTKALHEQIARNSTIREWPDEDLEALARKFKVSREVILLRLVELKLASREFYNKKSREWQRLYEKRPKKKKRGGGNISLTCLTNNGVPFVSLVLGLYRQDRINENHVADYLSIKVKHLDTIEHLLRSRS